MPTPTKAIRRAAPTRPATQKPKAPDHRGPLRCHPHGIRLTPNAAGEVLTVERAQRRLTVRGKRRLAVNVLCPLGCEWPSVHPQALAESRRLDREAQAAPAGTTNDA